MMNGYPYFGFQTPQTMQQAQMPQQNAFMNPATSYQGAMPAGLFGPGAQPDGSVQQGASMNPQMMGMLGSLGSGLLAQSQNHQQPANMGQAVAPATAQLLGLMAKDPQTQQAMQNGMQGLMSGIGGMFGSGG